MGLERESKLVDQFAELVTWLEKLDLEEEGADIDADELEDLRARINAIRNRLNYAMGL